MDGELYFPTISDIFNELEDNRAVVFSDADKSVEKFFADMAVKTHLDDRFLMLIPASYWENVPTGRKASGDLMLVTSKGKSHDNKGRTKAGRSALSNLHTGKKGNSSAAAIRHSIAEDISKNNIQYLQEGRQQFERTFPISALSPDLSFGGPALPHIVEALMRGVDSTNRELAKKSPPKYVKQILYIKKSLLYLMHKKDYGSFFWLLFLCALFQEDIVYFKEEFPHTQYEDVTESLIADIPGIDPFHARQMENLPEKLFWKIRKQIVNSAKGEIFIAGPSLKDAFSIDDEHSIVEELQRGIRKGQLKHIHIFVTNPIMFDASGSCGDAIRDIGSMVDSVLERLCPLCEQNKAYLDIDFLPMLQIDHAVITGELMAFRSNKLWNRDRRYKGAFLIYLADYYLENQASEYKAHLEYLMLLREHSTVIYPDIDTDPTKLGQTAVSAYREHNKWREILREQGYQYTRLYKVYEAQIYSHVCNTWSARSTAIGEFFPSDSIASREDLYNPQNLLGDATQQVLLPYLKETEILFNVALKKHDSQGYCHIYPSLDLGFPNNVQRLAGGFATGMLVTWSCGINIVPIDTTVNVCTSSVFCLKDFNAGWLEDKKALTNELNSIFTRASDEKGYSFSFRTGNHFLLIAKDKDTDEIYLILHSSANELKRSYMGLYPVEGNWYSERIKYIPVDALRGYKGFYEQEKNWCTAELEQVHDGRYFRYLKDEDANHFIRMAHNFQAYNEQIHTWLGEHLIERLAKHSGMKDSSSSFKPIIKHHYYMPTDHSIALGTFAEPIGEVVPLFSAPNKPVYLFEIGADNWQINLGGSKGNVCLIPHGWGQQIDQIQSIETNQLGKKLVLTVKDCSKETISIASSEPIDCFGKKLRQFECGEDFLEKGAKMVRGRIVKTFLPCYEYSSNTIDKNNEYIGD